MACPDTVLVAIWGLETDFGADNGHFPTIRSLASLRLIDCRRPDKFRGELIAALQIVERGDMNPADMRGAWAGEIGQTQFLPSSYLKYAVGRDLIHNPTNALASTANYLKGYGWQRGEPWDKAPRISRYCCNGIRRRSTPRRWPISRSSSPAPGSDTPALIGGRR